MRNGIEAPTGPGATLGTRVVALDMDGTLLRPDLTIGRRTLDAIAAADRAGIRVVVATGRGHRSAEPLLSSITTIDHGVLSNGSYVRDLRARRTLRTSPITSEALAAVLAVVAARAPGSGIGWEHADGFGYDVTYRDVWAHATEWPVVPLDRPPADVPLLKLLVRHPELEEPALLAALGAALPPTVTAATSGGRLVEITGHGVDKATGLAWLCDRWGVAAADVVAVGDNGNDVAMLRWAGRGVAMGNAHPDAVAAADERTAPCDEDGVALVLERVLDEWGAPGPPTGVSRPG